MENIINRAKALDISAHKRIDQRRNYAQQPYEVHLEASIKKEGISL